MVEAAGIIVNSRVKIENSLRKNKAFDANSAVALLQYGAVLDIMEQAGLITRTVDGKVYMTKKGQDEQIRGFSIKGPRKILRFSRNK